ncbi:MAG: class I SAM-dependent methyltransferase [Actinomycetota bacterium]|nr:class I SAM-dependent methyltransferase [Actinomycetota bacterium]
MSDPSSYYDAEAPAYDESRGGPARATAAADAVLELAPATGVCVDVAGGTGIVSEQLAVRGLDVVVVDRSTGMLRLAASRLSGRVLAADAGRLPFADGSIDLVTTIWLLHLIPRDADAVMAEAARILRPGGMFVTTVDKDLAHRATRRSDADEPARITRVLDGLGLRPAGATSFQGETRWSTPGRADRQVFGVAGFRKVT